MVLRNSINKPLCDGAFLSSMHGPHTAGAYLHEGYWASHQGHNHFDRQVRGKRKKSLPKLGMNCPNERFSSCWPCHSDSSISFTQTWRGSACLFLHFIHFTISITAFFDTSRFSEFFCIFLFSSRQCREVRQLIELWLAYLYQKQVSGNTIFLNLNKVMMCADEPEPHFSL